MLHTWHSDPPSKVLHSDRRLPRVRRVALQMRMPWTQKMTLRGRTRHTMTSAPAKRRLPSPSDARLRRDAVLRADVHFGAQTVRSLGAPPVGSRMQPDGMPSVSGMHRTHALCVVRSGERVWVRESMLTGCAD